MTEPDSTELSMAPVPMALPLLPSKSLPEPLLTLSCGVQSNACAAAAVCQTLHMSNSLV
jgi:hypothetical protein